ncbi:GSU2403 family nucleotidyltransferase fold protein [Stenotrophomonas sp. PS02298]|uniref:GSU2403 family nucleotidyltransferase fold protein n=1 Tax=Stenotrophomonas sp. PS02298 TaxID=2991424 RepID=UPI00249C6236|nr:GSU2403 family nucleotidyltransferase fold protein [Stenotrophomonas sp. PS02298]
MNDRAAFVQLVRALAPWNSQLLFVGGWAHRLYRLHTNAAPPAYLPLTTLDADVAFAQRERLDGNIRSALQAEGFEQQLTGDHRPPVSRYTLGEDASTGFYAEFLTPLIGPAYTRDGTQLATQEQSGITAQRLRYLDLLFLSPWSVTLNENWDVNTPLEVRIPNPVAFIVQKLLIHTDRATGKQSQDLLYIHDTLELFTHELDKLNVLWRDEIQPKMDPAWVRRLLQAKDDMFESPRLL